MGKHEEHTLAASAMTEIVRRQDGTLERFF